MFTKIVYGLDYLLILLVYIISNNIGYIIYNSISKCNIVALYYKYYIIKYYTN